MILKEIYTGTVFLIILFFVCVVPLILTCLNAYYIFELGGKKKNVVEGLTWILGCWFSVLLCQALGIGSEWQEQLHSADSYSLHVILCIVILGLIGYGVLQFLASRRLPPLIKVLCIAFIYMGCAVCVLCIAQVLMEVLIYKFEWVLYLTLLPLNYILLSIGTIRKLLVEQRVMDEGKDYEKFTGFPRLIQQSSYWPVAAFFLLWPLLGICIVTWALFG